MWRPAHGTVLAQQELHACASRRTAVVHGRFLVRTSRTSQDSTTDAVDRTFVTAESDRHSALEDDNTGSVRGVDSVLVEVRCVLGCREQSQGQHGKRITGAG